MKDKTFRSETIMFYIQIIDAGGNSLNFYSNRYVPTSKQSEVEPAPRINSRFARVKATESIRNIQQVYYLEERLFL